MASAKEITEKYIQEHRSIKECLKKGLINYSSLSRLILKDSSDENLKSKEAVLIASRRFKDKIKSAPIEDKIIKLFKQSSIEIKNNITFCTIDKTVYPESLIDIEKTIKKRNDLFFSIEGTNSITLIFQNKYKNEIFKKFKSFIIEKGEDLILISITAQGIGKTPGVVSYISGLFFENSVNMEEFISCFDDTLIVIKSEDLDKTIKLLKF